jgi:hypothetical protein
MSKARKVQKAQAVFTLYGLEGIVLSCRVGRS